MTLNRRRFPEGMSHIQPAQNQAMRPGSAFWPLLVVLISTVTPRLLSLGGFPNMDAGFYAYWAQCIQQSLAQGQGLPDAGGLMLYPALLSWLCAMPGNTLVWLRLADMLAAAWAGWLLCRLLQCESRSAVAGVLLALAFLAAMNAPEVIDAGFKNSIFAAYIPLFLALRLAETRDARSPRWFAVGALTALGVLLREPFVPFALAGAAAVWIGRGPRAFWRYAAGGLFCGLLFLALAGFLRGDVTQLFRSYLDAGSLYAQEAGRVGHNFYAYGKNFLYLAGPVLVLSAVSMGLLCRGGSRPTCGRALFWLALALLPLLEPMTKIGFAYHFAVTLPACAGLCALAWSRRGDFPLPLRRASAGLAALACLLQLYMALPGVGQARISLETLRAWPAPGWPAALAPLSNTLLAGEAVRAVLPPGGSLSSSAFAYFLYPVTGALPSGPAMSDLSRTYIAVGNDVSRLAAVLRVDPPDVLAVGFAVDEHAASFTREIIEAVRQSGLYAFVATIPVDKSKNYGWMGYHIYNRKPENE